MNAATKYYRVNEKSLCLLQFEAELFVPNVLHVLRFCSSTLGMWRQPFFQHIRGKYSHEGYSANAERDPESGLGRQRCPLLLVVYFEFPRAPTNQHTTATDLCSEEAEVVTGDAAAG